MHSPRSPQLARSAAHKLPLCLPVSLALALLGAAACSSSTASQPTLSTGAEADSGASDLATRSGADAQLSDASPDAAKPSDGQAFDASQDDAGQDVAGTSDAVPGEIQGTDSSEVADTAADSLGDDTGDDAGADAADAGADVDGASTPDTAGPLDTGPAADAIPAAPTGMVTIPGGSFAMGCVAGDSSCDASEKPQHSVTVDPFYLDRYEVTADRYLACAQAGKCPAAYSVPDSCSYGKGGMGNYPINCVTFAQAEAFCSWDGGRLPSEAEWEFAARGGLSGKKFAWGDEPPTCTAGQPNSAFWAQCTTFVLAPVGSVGTPNGYGLYDMAGGVVELVADWYSPTYYANSPSSNPKGPSSGTYRVARDLALAAANADGVRVSKRGQMGLTEYDKYYGTGFRCARSLP